MIRNNDKAPAQWLRSVMLGLLMLATYPAMAGTAVVIVNKANPVAQMNAAEVKSYFMKSRKVWRNGEKVRPVDQKAGADREAFLSQALKLTEEDLVRYWLEKQYVTAEAPPMQVDSDSAVIKFVGAFKGGIGVINKASMEGEPKVKAVLEVDY